VRRSSRAARLALIALPLAVLCGLELIGFLLRRVPAPASQEARTAYFNATFYESDPDLVVRLRPNLRTSFGMLRPDRDIEVATNASGFRGELVEPPDPQAFRVLVFGDSVTFGLNVAEADAWPAACRAALLGASAGKAVQVRNLAVPGYSTFQGVELFRRHVLQPPADAPTFAPHAVVFGFGFNDAFLRPVSDREASADARFKATLLGRLTGLVARSHFLRLFRSEPSVGDRARVPQEQLAAHVGLVARECKQRAIGLVLIDTCLTHAYASAAMRAAAADSGARFLSFRDALAAAKGLPPTAAWPAAGRVRVEVMTHGIAVPPSPDARPAFYALASADAALRAAAVRLPLNDDGRDGDRAAGDGTWTFLTPEWPAGARPQLAFGIPGFADRVPDLASDALMLNGLHFIDLPFVPPQGGEPGTFVVTAPNVLPWPDLVLAPDPIHPSEAGGRILGLAVAAEIEALPAFQRFAGR
jgi:lysophospholipase L1-like esterase